MFVRSQEGPWEDSGLDEGSSELGEDSGDGEGAAVYRALLCAGWVGSRRFPTSPLPVLTLTSLWGGKDATEVTEAQRMFVTPSVLNLQDNMKPGVFCMLSHFSCVRLFATLWTVASPGSSVHGIFQAGTLVGVASSFSRYSSQPRDQTCVSCIFCIGRQVLYHWATREAHLSLYGTLQMILGSCVARMFSSFLRRGQIFTTSLQAEYLILNLHSEPGEDSWIRGTVQPFLMELAYLLTALVWWRNATQETVFYCINWILQEEANKECWGVLWFFFVVFQVIVNYIISFDHGLDGKVISEMKIWSLKFLRAIPSLTIWTEGFMSRY